MPETPVLPLHMRRDEFDPIPEMSGIRESGQLRRVSTLAGPDAWLVTRYDDVRSVLSDWQRFSNALDRMPETVRTKGLSEEEVEKQRAGNPLAFDPPDHTRLRRVLTPEFTIRRMRRMEPRIKQIVDEHLDAMEHQGSPADLVSSFALPVPSLVICELLGVPYEDRDDFQRRSSRLLDASLSAEESREVSKESREYMGTLVERAKADPGEDMLGMLVREHGSDLTADELIGIAGILLIAGHETTSNMLGLGTLALLRHPDQLAVLREEPERADAAVEELLRWLSIVHSGTLKVATEETEIAGQMIKPGEVVMCSLPMANRDPALMDDPERLDITRGSTGHVAFGHGVHHCLGAPLARMEMRIAFPALFDRFPRLRAGNAEFRSFHVVYGLHSLEVEW